MQIIHLQLLRLDKNDFRVTIHSASDISYKLSLNVKQILTSASHAS
jgi:hypothetical protein